MGCQEKFRWWAHGFGLALSWWKDKALSEGEDKGIRGEHKGFGFIEWSICQCGEESWAARFEEQEIRDQTADLIEGWLGMRAREICLGVIAPFNFFASGNAAWEPAASRMRCRSLGKLRLWRQNEFNNNAPNYPRHAADFFAFFDLPAPVSAA